MKAVLEYLGEAWDYERKFCIWAIVGVVGVVLVIWALVARANEAPCVKAYYHFAEQTGSTTSQDGQDVFCNAWPDSH